MWAHLMQAPHSKALCASVTGLLQIEQGDISSSIMNGLGLGRGGGGSSMYQAFSYSSLEKTGRVVMHR